MREVPMKQYPIALAALAVLTVSAHAQETSEEVRVAHWACWGGPKRAMKISEYFDLLTPRTTGDPLHACRFARLDDGTGMELRSDGTGFILVGYRMRKQIPFNDTDIADLRWRYNDETGILTIWTESRYQGVVKEFHGTVRTTYSRLLGAITDNVLQLQSTSDSSNRPLMWKLDSPEDQALRQWGKCMAGNKGKGFDIKPCVNPLTGEEVVAAWTASE